MDGWCWCVSVCFHLQLSYYNPRIWKEFAAFILFIKTSKASARHREWAEISSNCMLLPPLHSATFFPAWASVAEETAKSPLRLTPSKGSRRSALTLISPCQPPSSAGSHLGGDISHDGNKLHHSYYDLCINACTMFAPGDLWYCLWSRNGALEAVELKS